MTQRKRAVPTVKDERGIAIVIALLVMTVLFMLGVAFLTTSVTERTVASNAVDTAASFYLAEAGMQHARKSLENLDISEVLDGTTPVFTGGNTVNLAGGSYTVQVTNNIAADGFPRGTIQADPSASATVDNDLIIVVTTTGTFGNTTKVTEAIIGSQQMEEAIAIGNNLDISGNPTVNGSAGSIHANGDFDISGNVTVSQDLTASGNYTVSGSTTVGGVEGGGQPSVSVPPVVPADYRPLADYVLKADGKVYQSDGTTVVFDTSGGDAWPSNDGGWKISGAKWDWVGEQVGGEADSVFYIEGNAVIGPNPGTTTNPWQVTVIAEGYLEISGSPVLEANNALGLLFIAGTDVKIGGNPLAFLANGIIAAHEQFGNSGTMNFTGYIVAEDAATNDATVEFSYISGEPTFTYDGGLAPLGGGGGGAYFTVLAWREVI